MIDDPEAYQMQQEIQNRRKLLKKIYGFVLLLSSSLVGFAQTTPKVTQIPEPQRTQIELALTKMDNTGLKASQLKSEADKQMTNLQNQYASEKKDFDALVASTKVLLKLPDTTVLDPQTLSFSTPTAAPAPVTPAVAPTKKP